jgi:secondary thiamine-phosphate synthase enzyme
MSDEVHRSLLRNVANDDSGCPMRSEVRSYDTSGTSFLDLTRDVHDFAAEAGADGLLHVFAPHATAGLALMETGSGSEQDLQTAVDRLLPPDESYKHSHGSPGHGRDHVLPAFISPSLTLPVVGGEVQLGTWQSIVLVDTNRDNPHRKVRFSFVES